MPSRRRVLALAPVPAVLAALIVIAVPLLPATTSSVGSGTTLDVGSAAAAQPRATGRRTSSNERDKSLFPTRRSAGVPVGWTPKRTATSTVTVDKPGAVVEDLRIVNGDLNITAPDVTVRRVEVQGGVIDNFAGSECSPGLKLIAVTVRRAPGQVTEGDFPAIGVGGYTARRVEISGLPEGFRVGGAGNCGPVKIVNSWATVTSPDICEDWHGDGLQGYDGGHLVLRRSVLKMRMTDDCGGTAPFFYPADQGNTSVDIDGLVVAGGGYPFRLGMPGTVRNLHIVQGSWVFGPIDVKCDALSTWEADIAVLRGGQPRGVRTQRCNTDSGT
jgi:hypothetical protein